MTEGISYIHLDEVESTNSFLHAYSGKEGSLMTIAHAEYQTAGRGQGGNRWESAKGLNLTFSVKSYPVDLPVNRQYLMLEAGALAVYHALSGYSDGFSIKWPNDIYWKDYKISGTLSECSVSSHGVRSCILGTGINVNQTHFQGNVPNPISLSTIVGHEVSRMALLDKVTEHLAVLLERINKRDYEMVDKEYKQHLYRSKGYHLYEDANGRFEAEYSDILDNGHLLLKRRDGLVSEYAFKEVAFVLP